MADSAQLTHWGELQDNKDRSFRSAVALKRVVADGVRRRAGLLDALPEEDHR
jgi:hypothetical protein